jgi:hypothetical protein
MELKGRQDTETTGTNSQFGFRVFPLQLQNSRFPRKQTNDFVHDVLFIYARSVLGISAQSTYTLLRLNVLVNCGGQSWGEASFKSIGAVRNSMIQEPKGSSISNVYVGQAPSSQEFPPQSSCTAQVRPAQVRACPNCARRAAF